MSDPLSRFRKRPKFPDVPRLVRLINELPTRVEPLPRNTKLPLSRTISEKYNPMPQQNPKHKGAESLDKGECQRIADWQISHQPNCNLVHESTYGWDHLLLPGVGKGSGDSDGDDSIEQARLVAGGAFRHVWMIRESDGITKRALKTLRYENKKNFDLRNFDRHRRDAVSMGQLTSSPLVVDIYGHCSNSALFDWGEGGDLESIFQREPNISKERLLHIAYNVSLSIAHAHNFDDRGRPTIAHTDIKPDQFLYQDGYYRLTDFNRVRFLMWNKRKDEQCGFHVGKNGGIWRAPEEYAYKPETEKVDVYSLGNVLYFLLTQGTYPWNDYHSNKEVYKMVMQNKRPKIPKEIRRSDHPYDKYMVEAIGMAYTHVPEQRPSALEIANKLKEGIQEL